MLAILADGVVCISRTVERDFRAWMRSAFGLEPDGLASTVIALGSDPLGFLGPETQSAAAGRLPPDRLEEKFVLMVGTSATVIAFLRSTSGLVHTFF